jgi:hypothetical protein
MKVHTRLSLIAVIAFCFGGQVTTFAQNVTVPREPTPTETEGPKAPSAGQTLVRDLIGAIARVVCEHSGKCLPSSDTPTQTETPTEKGFGRGRTPIESNRTGRSAEPSYTLAPRPSFAYFTPSGWRAFEEQSSITVAPQSEYINGNLANGVIFGLADLNGASFESGTYRYVRGILSANKYLKRIGRSESSVINNVSCITSRLAGPSPQSGYTENVEIYTCQHSAENLFYVVNVTSGPNASQFLQENSRVIQSISFR